MARCLLLIDLQNEFLSSNGNFPVNQSCLSFLANVETAVHHFRSAGDPIFWIRSEYATTSVHSPRDDLDPASFLSGTHSGRKPCCARGSRGAEFLDQVAALIDELNDKVITKTWFSSFKETTLFSDLVQRGVKELYIGGVLTNVCVLATVTDAAPLQLRVHVIEDCLGWRNRSSHDKAIAKMRDLGAQITSSVALIGGEGAPDILENGSKDLVSCDQPCLPILYYVNGSIPSWRVMMALYEKDILFEPRRLKVMSNPRETRLPSFLAINHRGKTPVFVDIIPEEPSDATDSARTTTINVNESLAILEYVETYYNPQIPLLPPTFRRKDRALVLSRIQETENLHYAYDDLEDAHFCAANDRHSPPLDPSRRAELISAVHDELDFWEVYAGHTNFIAGNEFGLADCAFFPILAYMVHRGFEWRRPGPADGDVGHFIKQRRTRKGKIILDDEVENAWPSLKAYFERVWNRNGEDGCAQRAQPSGWHQRGKANVWKGTTGDAKPLKQGVPRPTLSD